MKDIMRNGREAMKSKGESLSTFPSTLNCSPNKSVLKFATL